MFGDVEDYIATMRRSLDAVAILPVVTPCAGNLSILPDTVIQRIFELALRNKPPLRSANIKTTPDAPWSLALTCKSLYQLSPLKDIRTVIVHGALGRARTILRTMCTFFYNRTVTRDLVTRFIDCYQAQLGMVYSEYLPVTQGYLFSTVPQGATEVVFVGMPQFSFVVARGAFSAGKGHVHRKFNSARAAMICRP
jgi:hypothetical protein